MGAQGGHAAGVHRVSAQFGCQVWRSRRRRRCWGRKCRSGGGDLGLSRRHFRISAANRAATARIRDEKPPAHRDGRQEQCPDGPRSPPRTSGASGRARRAHRGLQQSKLGFTRPPREQGKLTGPPSEQAGVQRASERASREHRALKSKLGFSGPSRVARGTAPCNCRGISPRPRGCPWPRPGHHRLPRRGQGQLTSRRSLSRPGCAR
jgi:hypothetical protein